VIAVFLTALSQVYQSHVMKSVPGITVMALIRQSYPIALVLLALVAPAFESVQGFVEYKWTSAALALLGVSCAAAIAVNYAIVAIVGRFSALTYQVTGHLKTVLLFVAGWVVFEEHYHDMTFVGMAVTAVGLVLYTREQLKPKS
jgi:solute carrier family 35 protein E3